VFPNGCGRRPLPDLADALAQLQAFPVAGREQVLEHVLDGQRP